MDSRLEAIAAACVVRKTMERSRSRQGRGRTKSDGMMKCPGAALCCEARVVELLWCWCCAFVGTAPVPGQSEKLCLGLLRIGSVKEVGDRSHVKCQFYLEARFEQPKQLKMGVRRQHHRL